MGLLSPLRWKAAAALFGRYVSAKDIVLDMGCGNGWILRQVARRGTGVDKNGKTLPKDTDAFKFVCGDATSRLPLPAAHFDVCIMSQIIEHMTEPEKALTECRRLLRPGGRILITTPKPWADPVLSVLAGLHVFGKFYHVVYYTPHGLADMVKRAGFKSVEIHSYNLGLDTLLVARR